MPWLTNGLNGAWENIKKFGTSVANVFNCLKDAVGSAMKFVANRLVDTFNMSINGVNIIIRGANKIPGVSIATIPTIPRFATGVRNFKGGPMMINDGIGKEVLKVGDTAYMPFGTDVYSGSETENILSKTQKDSIIINFKDITTPILRMWIKENLNEFKKAGISTV